MNAPQNPNSLFERIRFRGQPVAHPDSVVVRGNARFTVLTPRLIRLEWAERGEFEDRGTYAFPTRYTPTLPNFDVRAEGETLVIDTAHLILRYVQDSGMFKAENLSIAFELNGEPQVWRPGTPNPLNLRGTRRTLDECDGDAALDEGLLSRAGWTLFDDSRSVVFGREDGWVAPRPDHVLQDWYFFGYGHDYAACLADYSRFGGPIPLIPRYVLGAWWSRYWAYSAQDLKDLVGEFEAHDVPLDVLVVDMDWHTPHAWTGYTWNRKLFPDPPGFLQWVHDKGLRATFNLHPAQGVQHFEEIYPRFAEAMGLDPASKQAVPFRIADKRFVRFYFSLLHHPMEEQGVDFWWVDWQQGESTEVKGLDPLPWLNHLHFNDSTRRGQRPMLYSRWGGLGNHRYHIGFSGDTYVVWPALQFQPYMTATASNVAYGWWSHDIGGHMGGATEPELYARWVQFGALSPCLRLHSTKDPLAERRPWAYPDEVYRAAKAAFHLRYQMVPYLYTMARVASEDSLPLCRPMYYAYPEEDAAYAARYQYFLGDQAIAAPIVHPADPQTGMAATDIWIPAGTWIDYQTKETYDGPRWVRLVGDLDRLPLLVKAGGILPLAPRFAAQEPPRLSSGTTDALPRDWLVLSVYPGPQGVFRVYEDDGVSQAYEEGQFEWTEIRSMMENERTWTVEIAPVVGRCEALPSERGYDILLEGSHPPEVVMLDDAQSADWEYNPETLTTIVHLPKRDKRTGSRITAFANRPIVALGKAHNEQLIRSDVQHLLGEHCPADPLDVEAILRTNTPGRADAIARLGGPFVRFIEFTTPEEASQQLGRVIVGAPQDGTPYDLCATFVLHRGGQAERRAIEFEGSRSAHILDTPFAFDGSIESQRWEAEVRLTWRGQTLTYTHTSEPLFPAIYAWQAIVYDQEEQPLGLGQVMNPDGTANETLDWQPYVQSARGLRTVREPHLVFFSREYREQLQANKRLAGYLTTTIVSPDEREAVLRFGSPGPVEIYVNGHRVAEAPAEEQTDAIPRLRRLRETVPVHLQAGENALVVATRPRQEGRPIWLFAGGFTPPGCVDVMTDLKFVEIANCRDP